MHLKAMKLAFLSIVVKKPNHESSGAYVSLIGKLFKLNNRTNTTAVASFMN